MGTQNATMYLTFRRNGQWNFTWNTPQHTAFNMVGTNYYDTASSAGGYWHINPSAAVGDQFECHFIVSDATGSIGNSGADGAASRTRQARPGTYSIDGGPFNQWLPLNVDRGLYVSLQDAETSFGGFPQGGQLDVIAAASVAVHVRVPGGQEVAAYFGTVQSMIRWNRAMPSGGGGGGGGCVHVDSWIRMGQQAHAAVHGDWMRGMKDADEFEFLQVESNRLEMQDCLRITMLTGATLVVSKTTPLTMRDNSCIMVDDLERGMELPVFYEGDAERPEPFWDSIVDLEEMGVLPVSLISVGGHCYAAGERPGAYVYTHNSTQVKN